MDLPLSSSLLHWPPILLIEYPFPIPNTYLVVLPLIQLSSNSSNSACEYTISYNLTTPSNSLTPSVSSLLNASSAGRLTLVSDIICFHFAFVTPKNISLRLPAHTNQLYILQYQMQFQYVHSLIWPCETCLCSLFQIRYASSQQFELMLVCLVSFYDIIPTLVVYDCLQ